MANLSLILGYCYDLTNYRVTSPFFDYLLNGFRENRGNLTGR
jgi:hypothetical protein